jgi:hypothetical protein
MPGNLPAINQNNGDIKLIFLKIDWMIENVSPAELKLALRQDGKNDLLNGLTQVTAGFSEKYDLLHADAIAWV